MHLDNIRTKKIFYPVNITKQLHVSINHNFKFIRLCTCTPILRKKSATWTTKKSRILISFQPRLCSTFQVMLVALDFVP